MIILELNEFSAPLLRSVNKQISLPTISNVLDFKHAETTSSDDKERFGLDPWVQWVSIHTGQSREEHGIEHLAEAHFLTTNQVWDKLGEMGFKYGVWGCMNAKYYPSDNCDYFITDPWTYTEQTKPQNLESFVSLARYYSKNYLRLNLIKLLIAGCRSLLFLILNVVSIVPLIPVFLKNISILKKPGIALFLYFDLISAVLFSRFRRKNSTEFNIIFLNSLAHYQHNDWPDLKQLKKSDIAFFRLLDATLHWALEGSKDEEPIVVMNAFSQVDSSGKGEILYRQKNPRKFFEAIGLKNFKLEQLMTNDSQLIFASEADKAAARELISSIKVDGLTAFHVDGKTDKPAELFCQFILWKKFKDQSEISLPDNRRILFFEYFESVVMRTGEHVKEGDIFYRGLDLPLKLYNHQFYDHVLKHYEVSR